VHPARRARLKSFGKSDNVLKKYLYPVESPAIYGEDEKKGSFLIEGGVQSPALSNGVYPGRMI
jgi:hypothetical protein